MKRGSRAGAVAAVGVLFAFACGDDRTGVRAGAPGSGAHGGNQSGAGEGGEAAGGRAHGGRPAEGGTDGSEAGAPVAGAPEAGAGGAGDIPVRGVVVDLDTGRPLPDRIVSVDSDRVVTDASGKFALHARNTAFDVVVTDPDGAAISIYEDVTSTALTLVHTPSGGAPGPSKSADLQGNLSGGGAYPLAEREGVALHFLSAEAEGSLVVPATLGPDFGPMRVAWDGPDTLEGKVVAIRFAADDNGVSRFDGLAVAEVSLTAGEVMNLDLALGPAREGRLTGSIVVPEEHGVGFVQRSYRVPSSPGRIPFSVEETSATTFDLTVVDLSALGGSYCVSAGSSLPFFKTERCGLALNATAGTLVLQAPPELIEPADATDVAATAEFAWSAYDRGVHRLAVLAAAPSAATPNLYVLTRGTSTRLPWPLDPSTPASSAYSCSVAGFGPFETLDEALSERGIAARVPTEIRSSYSSANGIVVRFR